MKRSSGSTLYCAFAYIALFSHYERLLPFCLVIRLQNSGFLITPTLDFCLPVFCLKTRAKQKPSLLLPQLYIYNCRFDSISSFVLFAFVLRKTKHRLGNPETRERYFMTPLHLAGERWLRMTEATLPVAICHSLTCCTE